MPIAARTGLVLIGLLISYSLALCYLALFKRGLIAQRAKDHWRERLSAAIDDRSPDFSFKDVPDLAAWIYIRFYSVSYAIGLWNIEDDDL